MGLGLPKDFRELLELLIEKNVRYLLVGGYAVGNYGHSRSTNDIDFFVAPDRKNADRLVTALTEFGFGENLSAEAFTKKDSLVVMGVEPMAIEFLNYLSGVDFESAYERRVIADDDGLLISVIGLEDLLTNKRTVGRHKDLADVEYLERVHNLKSE